jgi:hypothetical protein
MAFGAITRHYRISAGALPHHLTGMLSPAGNAIAPKLGLSRGAAHQSAAARPLEVARIQLDTIVGVGFFKHHCAFYHGYDRGDAQCAGRQGWVDLPVAAYGSGGRGAFSNNRRLQGRDHQCHPIELCQSWI